MRGTTGTWLGGMGTTLLLVLIVLSRPHPPKFAPLDDAYMFYRYALHLRSGLGISWNLDGIPTFGLTSLSWLTVVFLLSFICSVPALLLVAASWGTAVLGTFLMADAVARSARGPLHRLLSCLPLVGLPLFCSSQFLANAHNGLDTMLGVVLNTLVMSESLRFAGIASDPKPASGAGWRLGAVAFLVFFTRPECAPCAFLVPLLLWLFGVGRFATDRSPRPIVTAFPWGGGLIAAGMLGTWAYFRTPLPLSFYIKSGHGYVAYAGYWGPRVGMFAFFATAQVFLAAVLLTARPRHLRLVAACWIPVALCFLYLGGVLQIMGTAGRYYMPFLPYVIVPALLLLDEAFTIGLRSRSEIAIRATAALLVLTLGTSPLLPKVLAADTARRRASLFVEPMPGLADAAGCPLPPMSYADGVRRFSDDLLPVLPAGATVAASEVGYPGAMHPQINIIDELGLNDRQIALQGFSVDALLDRKPDLIWMPHRDYTWRHGNLLSSPRLYREYTVYAGALNYGVAVRKDSAAYAGLQQALARVYRNEDVAQYVATGAEWNPTLRPAGPQERQIAAECTRPHAPEASRAVLDLR